MLPTLSKSITAYKEKQIVDTAAFKHRISS